MKMKLFLLLIRVYGLVFGNCTGTRPELRVGGVNGGVLICVYTKQSPQLKHSSV